MTEIVTLRETNVGLKSINLLFWLSGYLESGITILRNFVSQIVIRAGASQLYLCMSAGDRLKPVSRSPLIFELSIYQ